MKRVTGKLTALGVIHRSLGLSPEKHLKPIVIKIVSSFRLQVHSSRFRQFSESRFIFGRVRWEVLSSSHLLDARYYMKQTGLTFPVLMGSEDELVFAGGSGS